MTKIAVIDYGMGNLHSVGKALEKVCSKEQILVTSNPEAIKTADKIEIVLSDGKKTKVIVVGSNPDKI